MRSLCDNRSFIEGTRMARPPRPKSPLRLAFAAALLFAFPLPGHAKVILGEPEVDRASDQFDGLWCPAEQIQMYNGTFTADGPEVTLEFIATNHHLGNWR